MNKIASKTTSSASFQTDVLKFARSWKETNLRTLIYLQYIDLSNLSKPYLTYESRKYGFIVSEMQRDTNRYLRSPKETTQ